MMPLKDNQEATVSISKSLNRGVAFALGLKAPRKQKPTKKTYVEQSWSEVGKAIIQSADQSLSTER